MGWLLDRQRECPPQMVHRADPEPAPWRQLRFDWLSGNALAPGQSGTFLRDSYQLSANRLYLQTGLRALHFPTAVSWKSALPQFSGLSLLPLDPYQQRAAELVAQRGKLQLSGSGKSYWLAEQLLQRLTCEQPTLVIGPNLASLYQLRDHLARFELDTLSFLYSATHSDRELLMRTLLRAPKSSSDKPSDNYSESVARVAANLQADYQAGRGLAFGGYSPLNLISLYLRAAERTNYLRLHQSLSGDDFSYDPEEYRFLLDHLRQTARQFEQLPDRHPALEQLHAGIFLHKTQEESQAFISDHLHQHQTRFKALRDRYLQLFARFEERMLVAYQHQFAQYRSHYHRLLDLLDEARTELKGERVLQSHPVSLRFLSLFGKVPRQALQWRRVLRREWRAFKEFHEQEKAFSTSAFSSPPVISHQVLGKRLRELDADLRAWQRRWRSLIKDETLRLNEKTIPDSTNLQESVRQLERDQQAAIEAINDSGLFQLPIETNSLTLYRQQKSIERIIDQLGHITDLLKNFEVYFQWQHHWFGLPARVRRLATALLSHPIDQWESLFSAWYFYRCLEYFHQPRETTDTPTALATFDSAIPIHRAQAFEHLRSHWRGVQRSVQSSLLPWIQQSENALLPLDQTNPPDALTRALPIWLTTPAGAEEVLQSGLPFQACYFEDASALPHPLIDWANSTLPEFIQLLPASFDEDAFQLAHLHHQGVLRPLLSASHAESAPPLPAIVGVDGLFDEETVTNEAEAVAVVQALNDVEMKANRRFPRVGIVCTTVAQRALIQRYLWQVKVNNGGGKARIAQLERNGLQVSWIGEIWGMEFDILFLSGVFGPVNTKGHLPADLETYWSEIQPLHLVHLFRTNAREVVVFNSLPNDQLNQLLLTDGCTAGFLWAALLRYLTSFQEEDQDGRSALRAEVHRRLQIPSIQPHPLYQELHRRLRLHYPSWDWQLQLSESSLLIPLAAIRSDCRIALLLDGFIGTQAAFSPDWEHQSRQHLARQGWKLLDTPSTDWWLHPEIAIDAIGRALKKFAEEASSE